MTRFQGDWNLLHQYLTHFLSITKWPDSKGIETHDELMLSLLLLITKWPDSKGIETYQSGHKFRFGLLQNDPIPRGLKPGKISEGVITTITKWPDSKGIETCKFCNCHIWLSYYKMTRFQGDWNLRVDDWGTWALDYKMTRFQGDWNVTNRL